MDAELCLQDIGRRIMERRRKLGLTQEALAEKGDVTAQFVSYAEAGKRAMRPENLLKIAAALGVSDRTVGRALKKNAKSPKGAAAKPKPVVGADGKRHSVPELTPAERLELDAKIHDMNLPVEEGGQGMTQQ